MPRKDRPASGFSILDAFGKRIKLRAEWTIIRDSTIEFVSGEPATFGPITYQGVVAPIECPNDIATLLYALRTNEPWAGAVTPFAYRFDSVSDDGTNAFQEGCRDSDLARSRPRGGRESPGDAKRKVSVTEEDFGAGEKLLGLLRSLDISNIIVVAARWNRTSFSGKGSNTPARYSALTKAASAALQRCYQRCMHEMAQPPMVLPQRYDRGKARAHRERETAQATKHQQRHTDGPETQRSANPALEAARARSRMRAAARDGGASARRAPAVAQPKPRITTFDPQIPGPFGDQFIGSDLRGAGHFSHNRLRPSATQEPVFVESELKPRFVALLDVEGPRFSRRDVHSLCAFKKPPPSLLSILQCMAMLRSHRCSSWSDILDMLHLAQGSFFLAPLDLRQVPRNAVAATRSFLLSNAFTPDDIRRQSKFGIVGYE